MTRKRKKQRAVLCAAAVCVAAAGLLSPLNAAAGEGGGTPLTDALTDSIARIAADCPGEVGVALIVNGADTATVNDRCVYPMMSVFKVHQALAVCHRFDREGISLDTLLTIRRDELDPKTWSPMLRDHPEAEFALPVRELLRYTLTQSDNNASNLLFERLVGVAETDRFIATLVPRESFRIAYSESEMAADHAKAYANRTSPLGAAMLMDRLFADSLVSCEKQGFIMKSLGECSTGKDRIAAPLLGKEGVRVAHKTGSGFTDNGVLAAHNDVARVVLPDGTRYTLAVFVKDFHGNEAQASRIAARVSAAVYSLLSQR